MPYSNGEWVPLALATGATTFQFGLPENIANDDQLLVYLLNENDPTDTLLSNGPEGNPLLSGTGQYLSYDPGLVSIADQTVTVDVSSLTPAELDAAAVYFLVFSEIESAPAAAPVYYSYSGGGGFGGGSGGGFGGFGSRSRLDYANTSTGGATAGSGGDSTPDDPGSGGGGGSDPAPAPAEKQFLTRLGDGDYVVAYGLLNEDDSFTKPTAIKFGSNVLTLNYSDTGVFEGSSNDELLDVILASVGLTSLDALAAGEISANATKSLLPSAQTLQLQDVWSRIGEIALKPNKDYDTLTQDKQLKLLNFQENLLKATALTDEFTGYKEDKELLKEIVELGNVYAAIDPQIGDNPSDFFLDNLWRSKEDNDLFNKGFSKLEAFYDLFEDRETDIKLLQYQKNILYSIKEIPELSAKSSDPEFVQKIFELGRLHFEAGEKLDSNTDLIPSELSTLASIDGVQDINNEIGTIQTAFDISQNLIEEARQNLLNNEAGATFFGLTEAFQLPQEYTTELAEILGSSSEIIISELSEFAVFNVVEYDQNPDAMVFISVDTDNVSLNESYSIGGELPHTTRDGDTTYPYYLVSRGGQIFYYPEGASASIFPGDQLLFPRSFESNFPIPLVEPFIAEELINPLLSLGGVGKDLGHFVLGAVYQYFINQGEFPRTLLSLDPVIKEWFEATEAEAEAGLPDTSAFQAGRLFGDGASVVTGAIEFIAGLNQAFRGLQAGISGCALTAGGACVPSLAIAGAAVAGGALRSTQGLYSAAAGIENIVEAVFAVSAGGNSGGSNQPLPGDPVRQVQGFKYRKSANNSSPENIDYEVEATGKGQSNRELAIENPDVIPQSRKKPVEFDWFDSNSNRVLDAKNTSAEGRYDVRRTDFMMEDTFKPDILKEARAQVDAIQGTGATGVEWRVRDRGVAEALADLFRDNQINITVRQFDNGVLGPPL